MRAAARQMAAARLRRRLAASGGVVTNGAAREQVPRSDFIHVYPLNTSAGTHTNTHARLCIRYYPIHQPPRPVRRPGTRRRPENPFKLLFIEFSRRRRRRLRVYRAHSTALRRLSARPPGSPTSTAARLSIKLKRPRRLINNMSLSLSPAGSYVPRTRWRDADGVVQQ